MTDEKLTNLLKNYKAKKNTQTFPISAKYIVDLKFELMF